MKSSRIKRLYPKKLAEQLARAKNKRRDELLRRATDEEARTVAKMEAKGFRLAAKLDSGEGVFVRDEEIVGLHVQLPSELYERLAREAERRETSKREVVIEALEGLLS